MRSILPQTKLHQNLNLVGSSRWKFSGKKVIYLRSIYTFFPFLPKRSKFSVSFVWITRARVQVERRWKIYRYFVKANYNSIPFLFSVPRKNTSTICIGNSMICSDISKLLYVISRAVRRVKFETILNYYEWYSCQISRTNHAIICLYYYPQKVCNFHM